MTYSKFLAAIVTLVHITMNERDLTTHKNLKGN